MSMTSPADLILVHSSDLHLGTDSSFDPSGPDPLSNLRRVLATALAARADLVVLAGDTFDNNRQSTDLLEQAARTMSDFGGRIVILPGNHDPLTPDSVYRRGRLASAANVDILGLTVGDAVIFSELDLEVCGKAHLDYSDMPPLLKSGARSTRWRLAAAHGHFVEEPDEPGRFLGSWLIRDEDLVAAGADYIALGHWNRAARVGEPPVNAYYSGAPDFAGTVNMIRFQGDGTVEVMQAPLDGASYAKPKRL